MIQQGTMRTWYMYVAGTASLLAKSAQPIHQKNEPIYPQKSDVNCDVSINVAAMCSMKPMVQLQKTAIY